MKVAIARAATLKLQPISIGNTVPSKQNAHTKCMQAEAFGDDRRLVCDTCRGQEVSPTPAAERWTGLDRSALIKPANVASPPEDNNREKNLSAKRAREKSGREEKGREGHKYQPRRKQIVRRKAGQRV